MSTRVSSSSGVDPLAHLQFLPALAAEDVAVLRTKEATYLGSWKRRGGTGAYHVGLARMMDRLEAMADTFGYDVFKAIAEQPGGEDGTLLAVLRDLRRYALLIESEMVLRGHVQVPDGQPEGLVHRLPHGDYSIAEARVLAHMLADGSFYDAVGADLHTTRDAVKRAVMRALYGAERPPTASDSSRHALQPHPESQDDRPVPVRSAAPAPVAPAATPAPAPSTAPAQPTFAQLKADELARIHATSAREARPAMPTLASVPEVLRPVPLGHPLDADGIPVPADGPSPDKVELQMPGRLPRRMVAVGQGLDDASARGQCWTIVDRQLETDDQKLLHLPRLTRELNTVELTELPHYYRHMYEWNKDRSCHQLKKAYERWGATGHF